MTDRIHIKPTEHGVVRVFDVDLPPEQIKPFNRRNGTWPLQEALGAAMPDPAKRAAKSLTLAGVITPPPECNRSRSRLYPPSASLSLSRET